MSDLSIVGGGFIEMNIRQYNTVRSASASTLASPSASPYVSRSASESASLTPAPQITNRHHHTGAIPRKTPATCYEKGGGSSTGRQWMYPYLQKKVTYTNPTLKFVYYTFLWKPPLCMFVYILYIHILVAARYSSFSLNHGDQHGINQRRSSR